MERNILDMVIEDNAIRYLFSFSSTEEQNGLADDFQTFEMKDYKKCIAKAKSYIEENHSFILEKVGIDLIKNDIKTSEILYSFKAKRLVPCFLCQKEVDLDEDCIYAVSIAKDTTVDVCEKCVDSRKDIQRNTCSCISDYRFDFVKG